MGRRERSAGDIFEKTDKRKRYGKLRRERDRSDSCMMKNKNNRKIKRRGKSNARKMIRLWTVCYHVRHSNVPAITEDVDDELYNSNL